MASSNCWKCLSRPSSQLTSTPLRNGFSTSSRTLAMPQQKKASAKTAVKGAKSFAMKKKTAPTKSGKPPMPGERKAVRKRIVLSNTNALHVDGLHDLSKDMELAIHTGKVVGLPGEVVDSLRAVEAFKVSQSWSMFRRPALLIREESVNLTDALKQAEEEKKDFSLVIDGERSTGKSLMLLHAMATAFIRGWIVLNIPEAQELTNAVTDYSPIPNTKPTLYSQNSYTGNWLSQILKANDKVLQELEMDPKKHKLPIPLQEKITLARLCELGIRDPDISWPIFEAFWAEITAAGRPPVLMALDGLSHIMQISAYRSGDFKEIHAHDLAIVKHFTEYLGGKKRFPNGGAVIAATSRSHSPISKSMDLLLRQAKGHAVPQLLDEKIADYQKNKAASPSVKEYFKKRKESLLQIELLRNQARALQRDPYEREYDPRVEESLQDVSILDLNGLSKHEARGLMEYWAQSGVLRQAVDERTVTEKWTLAGNGIVGEIERGALRMRI